MYRSGPRNEPWGSSKGAWTQADLEEPNVTHAVCALREKGAKPLKWFISQTKRCRKTLEEDTVIYRIKRRADVYSFLSPCFPLSLLVFFFTSLPIVSHVTNSAKSSCYFVSPFKVIYYTWTGDFSSSYLSDEEKIQMLMEARKIVPICWKASHVRAWLEMDVQMPCYGQ